MDSEPRNISISVYEKHKEEINKSDNASQAYIILANEALENKNKEYLVEIEKINKELDDLETDNGKLETSVTYMRGLLHNFNAVINHQKKIIKYNTDLYDTLKKHTKQSNVELIKYNRIINHYHMVFVTLLCLSWIVNFITVYDFYCFIVIDLVKILILGIYEFVDFNFINEIDSITSKLAIKLTTIKNKVEIEQMELEKINKSNHFIEDHIDNL